MMTDNARKLLSSLVTLNAEIKDIKDSNPEVANYIRLKRKYDDTEEILKDEMGENEYHQMMNRFRAMFAPKTPEQ